jgi:hypothetical protein
MTVAVIIPLRIRISAVVVPQSRVPGLLVHGLLVLGLRC